MDHERTSPSALHKKLLAGLDKWTADHAYAARAGFPVRRRFEC